MMKTMAIIISLYLFVASFLVAAEKEVFDVTIKAPTYSQNASLKFQMFNKKPEIKWYVGKTMVHRKKLSELKNWTLFWGIDRLKPFFQNFFSGKDIVLAKVSRVEEVGSRMEIFYKLAILDRFAASDSGYRIYNLRSVVINESEISTYLLNPKTKKEIPFVDFDIQVKLLPFKAKSLMLIGSKGELTRVNTGEFELVQDL